VQGGGTMSVDIERETLALRLEHAPASLEPGDILLRTGRLIQVDSVDQVGSRIVVKASDLASGVSVPAFSLWSTGTLKRVLLGPGERIWQGEIHYSADWL
jgi:hypothetical protein